MTPIRIVFNGWPLTHAANSPATLELHTLLARLPKGVEPIIATPGDMAVELSNIETIQREETDAVNWTQKVLPDICKETQAAILHTTMLDAPLLGDLPVISSPAGYPEQEKQAKGLMQRFGKALGQGGQARATTLWPNDLPSPDADVRLISPATHPAFVPAVDPYEAPNLPGLDLDEEYFIYHGPTGFEALKKVIDSWTWPAGSVGDYYPLAIVGLNSEAYGYVEYFIKEYEIEKSVRLLPILSMPELAELYAHCTALFQPFAVSAWGSPARYVLAAGRPLMSVEQADTDALVGPAGFLVENDHGRTLGASLIAMVTKPDITDQVAAATTEQAKKWDGDKFTDELWEVYTAATG